MSLQLSLLRRHGLGERTRALARKLLGLSASRILGWFAGDGDAALSADPVGFGIAQRDGIANGLMLWLWQHAWNHAAVKHLGGIDYPAWCERFDTPSRRAMQHIGEDEANRRVILVLLHVENGSAGHVRATIDSLLESVGQPWRAVMVLDERVDEAALTGDVKSLIEHDVRFLPEPDASFGHDITLLLRSGAVLRPHACRVLVDALRENPSALLAYSDEDRIAANGSRADPWFKPRFSRLLCRQGRLLGGFMGIRSHLASPRSLMDGLRGGNRSFQAQVAEWGARLDGGQVVHVPHVLYGERGCRDLPLPLLMPDMPDLPRVSVIIPTRDRWDLLGVCLSSLQETDWPAAWLEIVVVDNGSSDPRTLDMLARGQAAGRLVWVKDPGEFNWARLNHRGVACSRGEVLVFLNNDTEVIDPAWLRKMVSLAVRPEIGAVGCKLLYPDRTVQHGGVVAGIHGGAVHAHVGLGALDPGYCHLAMLTREVSTVTGACLAVTREKFERTEGFNEAFRITFNDTDFCFRLREAGFDNVWVGDSLLIHAESKSRGHDVSPERLALQREEAAMAWELHPDILRDDPCYSPNLSLWRPYDLAFLPRRLPVWDRYDKRPGRVLFLADRQARDLPSTEAMVRQVRLLRGEGHEVMIGGPRPWRDQSCADCVRYMVYDDVRAAMLAAELGIDLIIANSPAFYPVSRWTGCHPPVIACLHEDASETVPAAGPIEACRRAELRHALAMATAVVRIDGGGRWIGRAETRDQESPNWETAFVAWVKRLVAGDRQARN